MWYVVASVFVAVIASPAFAGVLDTLQTPAEASGWTISTPSQGVVDFVKTVAENSAGRIRYEDMGYTVYGKPLPLAVVGVPRAPQTPAEVGNRIVMLIQCNIHSGEIEGKEGSLLLLREIAQGKHDDLLKNAVLLINSNFNPDGNDTLGEWRINSQPTPKRVGTRTNAQGFNLNRDFVKLDSPEARAHLKVFRKWGPAIVVDEHATDGTRHRHPMAYGYGNNPNNDQAFEDANRLFAESIFGVGIGTHAVPETNFFQTYMKKVLNDEPSLANDARPPLTESVRAIPYMESYGGANTFTTFVNNAGVTERRPTRLTTGNGDGVRYTSNLPTIKNRIALLYECHSHNEYLYRVHTLYAATVSMIEQAVKQKDEILGLIKAKDEAASKQTDVAGKVVYLNSSGVEQADFDLGYGPGLISMEGFAYALSGDARISTTIDPTADRTWAGLEVWAKFGPGASTPMGALYVLDPAAQSSVEMLLRHGVKVYRLNEDVTLPGSQTVKFYDPDRVVGSGNSASKGNWNVSKASSPYEGHNPVTVISGDWNPVSPGGHVVTKGHYVISTAQPFGKFAAFMLEPRANDGLCYWNFWDEQLFSTEQNSSGSFDIVKTYSYSAIPEAALERLSLPEDEESAAPAPSDGGSGGCAAGYAAMSLLAIVPFFVMKKK
jgi:Synergist-CTERM protein sorting domain-containing protein